MTIGVRDQLLPQSLVECECLTALQRPDDAGRACSDAIAALERDVGFLAQDPRVQSALGKAHALLGNNEEAIRHGRRAVELWPIDRDALDGCSFELFLAEIYAMVGETGLAIERLDYLLSIPSPISVADLQHNSAWDPLRDNPRFQALLEKNEVEQ